MHSKQISFKVTKLHTRGLLAGLTTFEITRVPFLVGEIVQRSITGGAYRVISVEVVQ